jgi:ribosomal protein L11 methyltransferase
VTWASVRVWPDPAMRDAVTQVLFDHGSLALQDEGASIVTCFPEADVADLVSTIEDAAPGIRIEVTPVPDVDWSERWKDQARIHRLDVLAVAPPWLAAQAPPDAIIIEPAMAFGTGDHPTTRGALYLLEDVILPGDFVADLGAGSAILSIGAAKLGCGRVAAIEIDSDAIGNAETNVRLNKVDDCVQVIHGDALVLLPLLAPVDVIVANIISSVLIELLPVMDAALTKTGHMILSGILREEREHMLSVAAASGWMLREETTEAEWWSASFYRGALRA